MYMAIQNIWRPFGIAYGHLVYFVLIWYILRLFGAFYVCSVLFTSVKYIFICLVHVMSVWYMLCLFGKFYCSPGLVRCAKKNLAILLEPCVPSNCRLATARTAMRPPRRPRWRRSPSPYTWVHYRQRVRGQSYGIEILTKISVWLIYPFGH
jgi:hypothetical protein